MTGHRRTEVEVTSAPTENHPRPASPASVPGPLQRRTLPTSLQEAEERYAAARDEWTQSMQRASSGRPADLAALAMAQDAYESALMELNRWRAGERIAVETAPKGRGIDAVVGQELAWRRVHESESRKRPGLLGRIMRRLSGRD